MSVVRCQLSVVGRNNIKVLQQPTTNNNQLTTDD
jgi:hypothetical protein